jgi:hypothetical protein
MNISEAFSAIGDAKETLSNGDIILRSLAERLVGRLQTARIEPSVLAALKRELVDFDSHKRKWKE